jgi:hypothetical protein
MFYDDVNLFGENQVAPPSRVLLKNLSVGLAGQEIPHHL